MGVKMRPITIAAVIVVAVVVVGAGYFLAAYMTPSNFGTVRLFNGSSPLFR